MDRKAFILVLVGLFLIPFVQACPVCSMVFSSAAFSANYFGLDIIVLGLFVGATTIPFSQFINSLIKKQYFPFQTSFIAVSSFFATMLFIFLFDPGGTIYYRVNWSLKLMLGGILGALVTIVAFQLNTLVKRKFTFKFQKIITSFTLLGITGLILQIIFTKDYLLGPTYYVSNLLISILST